MKIDRLPRSIINSISLLSLLILVIFINNKARAESLLTITKKTYGLSIETASHGTGLGGFYSLSFSEKYQMMFQARFVDIMGEGEFPIYNWYTGSYTTASEKNLLLMLIYGGIKYFPFAGQIANNFSPFVAMNLGPILALDTPESGNFFERWQKVDTSVSLGILISAGIDIFLPSRTVLSIGLGYDYLPMRGKVDGKKEYSGMTLRFLIGKQQK